jgi:two-component system OmpR family sensor kinase
MRWKWLAALLPLGLGVAVSGLAASGWLTNPLFYLEGDLATLPWLVGLLLSGLAASYLLLRVRAAKNHQRDVAQVRAQAGEERRRFLRRLDHELKNPLTAIRAGLANLVEVGSEESQQQALSSVNAQVLRLSRLAADLRKLAELETRPLERTAVDVADLLQEVLEIARERSEATERHLRLTVPQAPWPLPAVNGDPDLLFLAVHNLVDNALKFTAPADTVELRAFEDGATIGASAGHRRAARRSNQPAQPRRPGDGVHPAVASVLTANVQPCL